jgi:hypothetical protein
MSCLVKAFGPTSSKEDIDSCIAEGAGQYSAYKYSNRVTLVWRNSLIESCEPQSQTNTVKQKWNRKRATIEPVTLKKGFKSPVQQSRAKSPDSPPPLSLPDHDNDSSRKSPSNKKLKTDAHVSRGTFCIGDQF